MKRIKKVVIVVLLILVSSVCLTACNKTILDTKYKFEKAHVRIDDVWFDVNVSKWSDYDGEQIQLILTDGSVLVINSRDCILYSGTLPTAPQEEKND